MRWPGTRAGARHATSFTLARSKLLSQRRAKSWSNKIYRFGFTERMDSRLSLLSTIDSLKLKRIIP